MQKVETKIFIIIVTYNGMKWLPKCLESTKPYDVVIIDNSSTDNTVPFVEEIHPNLVLLKQEANVGFGRANNIGISYALEEGADCVFLLNQDAYLHQGCLDRLLEAQKKHPEFGVLSPVHLNGKGDRLDYNFSNYVSYSFNPDFYSDYILQKEKKEIYEVPFVNAAGWLLSKKCLEIVGGFDPIFFHYGEDDNYCQRVLFHKLKIGVVPKAFMNHDREQREKQLMEGSFDKMARSLKITYSNINNDRLLQLENSLENRRKSKIKAYFKLNFRVADYYKKEIEMLERLIPQIKRSRSLNKQQGANYLES